MADPYGHPEFAALVAGLPATHAVGPCHDWLREHGYDDLADLLALPWAVEWRDEGRPTLVEDEGGGWAAGHLTAVRSGRLTAAGVSRHAPLGRPVGPLWAVDRATGRRWLVPVAVLTGVRAGVAPWPVLGEGQTHGICYEVPE